VSSDNGGFDSGRLSLSEKIVALAMFAAIAAVAFIILRWMVTTKEGFVCGCVLVVGLIITGLMGGFGPSRAEMEWRERVPVSVDHRGAIGPASVHVLPPASSLPRQTDLPNMTVRCTGSGMAEVCHIRTW